MIHNINKKVPFFGLESYGVTFVSVGLCTLIGVLIILSSVPPVSKDALTHHLAVPALYLKHGMIYEIPTLPFSYYPMNLELLYIIPLYFGNDIIPKYMHFVFALLTAWLVFGYLKRRTNIFYGLFGAVIFLSTPIIVKLSTTVYVDLGLIFFSTWGLLLFLRWIETQFQLRYLIFSAISCGLAMGTKYNGLITFFLLTLFVPFVYSGHRAGKKARTRCTVGYTVIFLFTALLFFSPWMFRNYLWTHNPIYPLYEQWFNPDHINGDSLGVLSYRALVYHEDWWDILLLPLRIFFQGQDGNPRFFDGKLNPFLLFFPIIGFLQPRKDWKIIRTEKRIFLIFSLLFFSFAFFSSVLRVRYISPIIPSLVILSVFGVKRLFEWVDVSRSPHLLILKKSSVVFFVLLAMGINTIYICKQFDYVKPFSYLSGEITRETYIARYRPEFPAMAYINNQLPSGAQILFVFIGNSGYYCNRPYLFDMENNKSRMETLIRMSNDIHGIRSGLKKEKITHLLINMNIFNGWANRSLSPADMKRMRLFFKKYLKPLYSGNGYSVFELKMAPDE